MDVNTIRGRLAFGDKGGYFWSTYVEGRFSGDIVSVLNKPYVGGDYSLGRIMKDYQHALLEIEKGKELSKDDLGFVCSMIGTEIVTGGKLEDCNIYLKPFEMKLDLHLADLKNNEFFQAQKTYEATNVRAGIFGFGGGSFGIRYDLTFKE